MTYQEESAFLEIGLLDWRQVIGRRRTRCITQLWCCRAQTPRHEMAGPQGEGQGEGRQGGRQKEAYPLRTAQCALTLLKKLLTEAAQSLARCCSCLMTCRHAQQVLPTSRVMLWWQLEPSLERLGKRGNAEMHFSMACL